MGSRLKFLRAQLRIKLQGLNPQAYARLSHMLTTKLIQHKIFIQSHQIACYIPIENEADVWPVITAIWQEGKTCYLPALSRQPHQQLYFVKFMPEDPLLTVPGYKVLEPALIRENLIAPEQLDLVIVPLLGFTASRFRLGRGAGCYDRTFAFKKENGPRIKPYLLGVGYKWQQVEFEPNPWDVALDEILVV